MKSYRVYFNRQMDWPMIWCVDEGDISTQIRCPYVEFLGVVANGDTRLQPKKVKIPPNEPVAWFDVVGTLKIDKGVASFS